MFFRVVLAFVALCSVAAFAPLGGVRQTGLKMATEKMVGGSIEVKTLFPNNFKNNDEVYDPLDLLKLHDLNPEVFPHGKWLRESELKHCRIAMLASIGAFTGQYGLVIPGYTAVADPTENLMKFFYEWPLGFAQIFLAIGIIEGSSNPSAFWNGKGDREAGNFHFDPTGFWNKKTQAEKNTLLLKELKNGRLAMMAMAAYTSEHWLPGSVPFLPGKF